LAGVIDRERNRIADHAGVDEEEPPGPPGYWREELRAGGGRVKPELLHERLVHHRLEAVTCGFSGRAG
jgi:hypothetical protein